MFRKPYGVLLLVLLHSIGCQRAEPVDVCVENCTRDLSLGFLPGGERAELTIDFQDAELRESTAWVLVWAIELGGCSCDQLESGEVDPENMTVRSDLVVSFPPAGDIPKLTEVPAREQLFHVEGQLEGREVILRGCTQYDVPATGAVDITVKLRLVCSPDPLGEIPGNGVDDDCDGLTDECETDTDCDDGQVCTSDLCLLNECHLTPFPDGLQCNDHDPCTTGDACDQGECRGQPKDCSAFGRLCAEGLCDPDTGVCGTVPVTNGIPCEDGLYCTVDDSCQEGMCTGSDLECDDGDECTRDECNEGDQRCDYILVPKPGAEGPLGNTNCSNGADDDCDRLIDGSDPNCLACTQDGDCEDGNECTTDSCVASECLNDPVGDGTQCDDGRYCTIDDHCAAGVCASTLRGCGMFDDACHCGVCVESAGRCTELRKPDGVRCDDGLYCTAADSCAGGICRGADRDCYDDETCTADTCNEDLASCDHILRPIPGAEGPTGNATCFNEVDDDCDGLTDDTDSNCGACTLDSDCDDGNECTLDSCVNSDCQNTPIAEGTKCSDDLTCTESDSCIAGVCTGDPRACDDGLYCNGREFCDPILGCQSPGDPCEPGGLCNACNEVDDNCLAPAGTPCLDGLFCNGEEACDGAGACQPGSDPCSGLTCNEVNDRCEGCATDDQCPPCQQCNAGICENQMDGDDLKDDCPVGECLTGTCDGTGSCGFEPSGTACDDGLYCTEADSCNETGICAGSGSPCQANEVCLESIDTCQPRNCAGEQNCTPCDDELFCTATDYCWNGVCIGFGNSCGSGEVCNENIDTCEPECALDCSSLNDQCNIGVCNPATGQCAVQPMPVGTACTPDGGDEYILCQDGVCTHWCNHAFQVPGDPDHECPVGYACFNYTDTDSAGYCSVSLSIPMRITGESCTFGDDCRAHDGYTGWCVGGTCRDSCSNDAHCRDTGPGTSDWVCQPVSYSGALGRFDHGRCAPPFGSGQTGDSCSTSDDCYNGYCFTDGSSECRAMCCTEEDCQGAPAGYICWFWEGGETSSTLKLCMDKGSLGMDVFGTACTGSNFFDSSCSTGLCVDVGEGERCNRYCCLDTHCPAGYRCDFAFEVARGGNKFNRVRACVPDVPRLPVVLPNDTCQPGDQCGMPIVVDSLPASLGGDNTGFSSCFNSHGSPMVSCTGYNYYGRDVIYEILVPSGSTLTATMTPPGGVDLGIYLLDVCIQDFSDANCLDGDDDGTNGAAETITWMNDGVDLAVYLVVDGWNLDQIGVYTLDITLTP